MSRVNKQVANKRGQKAHEKSRPTDMKRKKERREQKAAKSAVADRLVKEAGGQGVNIEAAASEAPALSKGVQVGETKNMAVQVQIGNSQFAVIAMAIIARGIKLGWLSTFTAVTDGNTVYSAYRYIMDVLISSATSGAPLVQHAPIWFWELCYSLTPKSAKFKTGMISYSTQVFIDESYNSPNVRICAIDPQDYAVFGQLADSLVNGFQTIIPGGPYDPLQGSAALTSLFTAYGDLGLNQKIADPGESNSWMSIDTSSFVASFAEIGQTDNAAGGLASTLYSERFIQCPLFAKFVTYQDSSNFRGWQELRHGAGSASYLGTRLSELSNKKQFANKVAPIFKMLNFDEYFEQLSFILCGMQERASQFTSFETILPYPLTAQQTKIMLRQALIPMFNNEMGQDLYLPPSDFNVSTWAPFCVLQNGCSTSIGVGVQPFFTQFFVEGIRAAKRKTAKLKGFGTIDFVPILGKTLAAGGDPTQYQWNNARTGTLQNLYQDPGDEVPINLFDASCSVGNTILYLDLNGNQLASYISVHNDWMKSYSTFSTGQMAIGTEEGIGALCVLDITVVNGRINDGPTAPVGTITTATKPRKAVQRKMLDRKVSKVKLDKDNPFEIGTRLNVQVSARSVPATPTYFQNTVINKYVSNLPQFSAAWKYKSLMVCPIFSTTVDVESGTTIQYQAQQCEPWSIPGSNEGQIISDVDNPQAFLSLQFKHEQAALLDIRTGSSSVESEMERDMNALGVRGQGGFFCNLAGEIAGALGWQGGKDIADTVGALTGL